MISKMLETAILALQTVNAGGDPNAPGALTPEQQAAADAKAASDKVIADAKAIADANAAAAADLSNQAAYYGSLAI